MSEGIASFLALCAIALIVEALAGYPESLFRAIGHPVTWIGVGLSAMDRAWNREADSDGSRRLKGGVALACLLAGCGIAAITFVDVVSAVLPAPLTLLVLGVAASSLLAQRSLHTHVLAVANALERDGIGAARTAVAAIVGRDTAALDEPAIARASIESLAENFADGVVAPAFWIAALGLPGGLLYKTINTADSMIGHRSPRHEAFGFCAAKLDDLVNWPAARLAALWLVAAAAIVPEASARAAWRVMLRDARGHPSPNAGWPEAAMAGALDLRLGGSRAYAGRVVEDAFIGDGDRRLDPAAIRLALQVYRIACGLQIAAVLAAALLIAQWP